MSILDSTSPAKKYDDLGVYYRKNFLTEEEVSVLSDYLSIHKIEENKYHIGFIKSNFADSPRADYIKKNETKAVLTKIKEELKTVYQLENLYINLAQEISISSLNNNPGVISDAYKNKDSDDKNGVVIKKFMKPTLDGWLASDAAEASPAWCVVVGLSEDSFDVGGEINVASVSQKIGSGDIIFFKDSIATSYSVSSFEPTADINTPEGETTPDTIKVILDLTITDVLEGYWQ